MPPLLTAFLARQRLAAIWPYLHGDVLDLGCGSAEVSTYLSPGQVYVGIDRRIPLIARLRQRYPQHRFLACDFDAEPLALDRRFDTVVLLAVIEHLRQPDSLFAQLPSLLQPFGRVVMTSPSAWGNWIHAGGARLGLFSSEAAGEHHTIFSARALAARLEPHGLKIDVFRRFVWGGNQLFVCRRQSEAL